MAQHVSPGGAAGAGFERIEAVLVDRHERIGPQARPPLVTRRAPRRPRQYTLADIGTFAAALASAAALCWLIFARLTEGTGWLGFVACTYLAFLVMFTVATVDRVGWLVAKDRLATVVVTTGAVILFIPLAWLVGYIVIRGLAALRPTFVISDMEGTGPTDPSTAGGGLHAIVGTIEQVGIALLVALPLGLACAIFLNESRSRWRRPVRVVVDAMSGLPSIVAGIFIYAVFILPNQGANPLLSFNGFMASLALAMIMLPPITRTVEVVLRLVPDGLREASLALGASRARTVWSVVLPTARTGVTTAVVLGLARAVGETAPLLFTAFGSIYFNANPFSGTQESLPLFVWRYIRDPSEASIERGFAGGLMLLLLVMGLFVIARTVGRDRSVTRRRARSRPRLNISTSTRARLAQGRPALKEPSSRD